MQPSTPSLLQTRDFVPAIPEALIYFFALFLLFRVAASAFLALFGSLLSAVPRCAAEPNFWVIFAVQLELALGADSPIFVLA